MIQSPVSLFFYIFSLYREFAIEMYLSVPQKEEWIKQIDSLYINFTHFFTIVQHETMEKKLSPGKTPNNDDKKKWSLYSFIP